MHVLQRGIRKLLEMMEMFRILFVLVVSRVNTSRKTRGIFTLSR